MRKRIILLAACLVVCSFSFSGCGKEQGKVEKQIEVAPDSSITTIEDDDSTNVHHCIVDGCEEDGTNEIIGISGETEYYCDKHYQELNDMMNNMKNSSSESNVSNDEVSKTYQTYNAAINLSKEQLTDTGRGYSYRGLDLLSEDCDWIDSGLNKKGTVNQGAVYRKMAKLLVGFNMHMNDYEDYAEILLGFTPKTRDDFVPYANNAMTFITEKKELQNIMKKFESVKCVKGSFNYKFGTLGKYSFRIKNLKDCAEEMQISEEMLGYILAMLDEYAPTIKFDGEECKISYESKEEIKKLSKKDFIARYEGKKHDLKKEFGSGEIRFFAFDASVDDSKEGVVTTYRGLHIGDTKKDLFSKYGKTKEEQVDWENDVIYNYFLSEGMDGLANLMNMQCSSYVVYKYKTGWIKFYLYESKKISWIVFLTY